MYRLPPDQVDNITQTGGVVTTAISQLADYYYITVTPSAGATGSLSFEARSTSSCPWEPIVEGAVPVVADLSTTNISFILDGRFLSDLRITPTDVTGSASVLIQQASQ
jgi:hypothetical protein